MGRCGHRTVGALVFAEYAVIVGEDLMMLFGDFRRVVVGALDDPVTWAIGLLVVVVLLWVTAKRRS